MREKNIAVVALNNHAYPDFQAKLDEAARWVRFAAKQGADLVVLPEALNCYGGDGPAARKDSPSLADLAMEDWQRDCRSLIDAAQESRVAVTIPVLTRESGNLVNGFFLLSREGDVLGRYQKRFLTSGELDLGFARGSTPPIAWEGLKIGGAICFDCYFPQVFQDQADAGVDLFLVPSFTPGGAMLNACALLHSIPIALAYPAWSRIIDLDGRELAAGGYRNETLRFGFGTPVFMAAINFNRVVLYADANQQKMVDLLERYGPRVRCRFDQDNVNFILESRDPALAMDEVLREYQLIPRRDYFRRAAMQQQAQIAHGRQN